MNEVQSKLQQGKLAPALLANTWSLTEMAVFYREYAKTLHKLRREQEAARLDALAKEVDAKNR